MDGGLNDTGCISIPPNFSRSGRIIKKSAKQIEAEESFLEEAHLMQAINKEPESFQLNNYSFDDMNDNLNKVGEEFCDSMSSTASLIIVSSDEEDETQQNFNGIFYHSDMMTNIPERHDSETRPDSNRTIYISSTTDEGDTSSLETESENSQDASFKLPNSKLHEDEDESDDESLCHKKSGTDHRYCTRFQHSAKPRHKNVGSTNFYASTSGSARRTKAHTVNAYVLWSSLNRRVISIANTHLQRKEITKKVQETWKALPPEEKQFWARKAKELSERMQNHSVLLNSDAGKNVAGLVREYPSSDATQTENMLMKGPENQSHSCGPWKKHIRKKYESENTLSCDVSWKKNRDETYVPCSDVPRKKKRVQADVLCSDASLKEQCEEHILGIAPVDVAAHLKLLGDSLTGIGQKVLVSDCKPSASGAYSVLLDSLLCSMGALLCLTRVIPGLEQLPSDSFAKTLDHIAYFLPGL